MAIGMIESCPGKVHTKGIAGGFFATVQVGNLSLACTMLHIHLL